MIRIVIYVRFESDLHFRSLFESSKRDLLSTLCVLLYCRPRVHIAVVSCLNRVEETLVMLKSALLQTKAKLKFHVFADDEICQNLNLK